MGQKSGLSTEKNFRTFWLTRSLRMAYIYAITLIFGPFQPFGLSEFFLLKIPLLTPAHLKVELLSIPKLGLDFS